MKKPETLILGIGNEILGDDSIGPRLVHDLSIMMDKPDIHFKTACLGGLEIMEHISGFDRVIFIDGIRTNKGKAGFVYHYTPADFKESSNLSSLHDIGFLTALQLAKKLSIEIPHDMHIIAVEVVEDKEFSQELSPVLRDKYPDILSDVSTRIQKIINT